ncbi:MAG TPA: lysylphosphatidylglycerol synthase transmembrane domain-containing protein [archaeon]|nr:lysylphosphatidylglycerol synthase transmembrane domain-containing protein [archaeon]
MYLLAKSKNFKSWPLKLLFGIGLLLLIFHKLQTSVIPGILAEIKIVWLPGIIVIYWIFFSIKTLRWIALFSNQGFKLRKFDTFRAYFYSAFIGLITVGQAGDLLKMYSIKNMSTRADTNPKNLTLGEAGVSVLIERFMEFALYLLLGGLIIIILIKDFSHSGLYYFILVSAAAFLAVIFLLCTYSRNIWLRLEKVELNRGKLFNLIVRNLKGLFYGLTQYSRNGLLIPIALTFCAWLTVSLVFLVLAWMVNIHISYFHALILFPVVSLVSMIPVTIAGFGTRELALIYCLSFYGVAPERTVIFSLMIFLITFLSLGLASAFFQLIGFISIGRKK